MRLQNDSPPYPARTLTARDGPVGSGRRLPRGVAQGRYCLAHDEYASIETVSRDGKGMFGAQAASETAHPSM